MLCPHASIPLRVVFALIFVLPYFLVAQHFGSLLSHLAAKITRAECRMDDLDKVEPFWTRLDIVFRAIESLHAGDAHREAVNAYQVRIGFNVCARFICGMNRNCSYR